MKKLLSTCLLAALCSCTTVNAKTDDPFDARDPMKSVNQEVFNFNLAADSYVIRPAAQTYHYVPDWGRQGVGNFLSNLSEPGNMVNGALQLDSDIVFASFWRFVLNTTYGLGGLRDFASENGLKSRETDFGETLASYGIGEGPYVVLPIVGPSTVRGTAGLAVDWFLDPVGWVLTPAESTAQTITEGIATRDGDAAIIDQFYYDSIEPYSATRAAYLQHQAFD